MKSCQWKDLRRACHFWEYVLEREHQRDEGLRMQSEFNFSHLSNAMTDFSVEVPVFVDTNLGTHIAMNVPPDITSGIFKRDFEKVHLACLPNLGEIQVNGLMVKRKSCFYHLPDSLPIKYVFQGTRRTWFLHVKVGHSKKLDMPCMAPTVKSLLDSKDLMACNNEDKARGNCEEKKMGGKDHLESSLKGHETAMHISKKQKNKKRSGSKNYVQNAVSAVLEEPSCRFEENLACTTNKSQQIMPENGVKNLEECNANSTQGSLSEVSTQVVSVTGIINKYFSSYKGIGNCGSPSHSDVTSKAFQSIEEQSKTHTDLFTQFTPISPKSSMRAPSLVRSVSRNSGNKSRTKVGKCLVVASQNLGISLNKSPIVSLCRFKDGKLSGQKVSQINCSIFEISDDED